jgi:CBS domain containing-hemolysin-like protein
VTALFITTAIILVIFGGLLTAIDGALSVLSRSDILDEAEEVKKPQALRSIAMDVAGHVTALTFVRVVIETFAAVLVTLAVVRLVDQWWQALLIASVIMIAVFFVVVGSSPRGIGVTHSRAILRPTAPLVRAVRVVLGPIAEGLIVLGRIVTPGSPSGGPLTSEEQLRSLVDEATHQDVLEEEDRELLHSVFEFGDTIVREVMVARTDMVSVDDDVTLREALDVFLEEGVSRMPVLGKDADDIVGVVYLRDVASVQHETPRKMSSTKVSALAKPALFIPESKKADDTLRFLQAQRNHLAIVVDEYGGVAGLVTLEDLMEELVGDISDEYDTDEGDIIELRPDVYRVSTRYSVDDLADLYDIDIDEDDVDTIGGLMTKHLGRFPESHSTVTAYGLVLTAEKTTGRKSAVAWIVVEPSPKLAETLRSRRELDQTLTGEITLP